MPVPRYVANFALRYILGINSSIRAETAVEAILYIDHNPKLVRSITSFPYIVNSV
jgi:hypothetical protein